MQEAILSANREQFLECVYVPNLKVRELVVTALFDFPICGYEFESKLLAAYGPDAVVTFRDPYTARKGGMSWFALPPRDEPWWEDVEINVESGKAHYIEPGSGAARALVEEDGVWRLDLTESIPDADAGLRFERRSLDGTRKCMDKIGQPGVEIDDLRRMLDKEWFD
jgi:hypothetical protein